MTFRKIRNLVAKIPKGKVTTYGEIAKALRIKDSRIVGWALHANKDKNIPCHRVINRFGFLAKNYSFGGAKTQKEKLKKEEIKFIGKFQVDLKSHFWKPNISVHLRGENRLAPRENTASSPAKQSLLHLDPQ